MQEFALSAETGKSLSPFSLCCNYNFESFPPEKNKYVDNKRLELSTQEQMAVTIINAVGAVASFQLEDLCWSKNTCRQKLKILSRLGVINRHKLAGTYTLNVYTPGKFPGLDKTLRLLALAQLYTRMFKLQPCSFMRADRPLDAYIKFLNVVFPVMVIRLNDSIKNLPLLVKALNLDRLIIVSDSFRPEFRSLDKRVRIAVDSDLISEPLFNAFLLPDGNRDWAKIFI